MRIVAPRIAVFVVSVSLFSLTSPSLAQRSEIVISADKLAAPEVRADEPIPGKWWFCNDAQAWGARDGKILMTGRPSEEKLATGFWDVIPLFRVQWSRRGVVRALRVDGPHVVSRFPASDPRRRLGI